MKNAILITLFLVSLHWVSGQSSETNSQTITITLENVLNDEGSLIVALHTSETFMKGAGVQNQTVKANKGEIVLQLEDVSPGQYAILVLHDKNENNRMDFETNGMPKEAWATSSKTVSFGPPSFEESKFEVADTSVNLSMRF